MQYSFSPGHRRIGLCVCSRPPVHAGLSSRAGVVAGGAASRLPRATGRLPAGPDPLRTTFWSPNGSNFAPSDPQKLGFRCRGVLKSQNVTFLQPDPPKMLPCSLFDLILASPRHPLELLGLILGHPGRTLARFGRLLGLFWHHFWHFFRYFWVLSHRGWPKSSQDPTRVQN